MPAGNLDRSAPTSPFGRPTPSSPSPAGPTPRDADVTPYLPSADPRRRPDETKLREIARRLGVSRDTLEQYLLCRDAGLGRDG